METATSDPQSLPLNEFRAQLVRLFDTINYHDSNWTRKERTEALRAVYQKALEHFTQPNVLNALKVHPKIIQYALQAATRCAVYVWIKATPEHRAGIAIYYTYMLLIDDCQLVDDPLMALAPYCTDLLQGNQQKNKFFELVHESMLGVMNHLGGYCALAFLRSTLDFYQGVHIERHNFQGFPHSYDYPRFLRRLNGLGQGFGAALFPAAFFNEVALVPEIATAIAQFDNFVPLLNDMISLYKEFNDPLDTTSLINNYRHVEGLTLLQAMEKLTDETVACAAQFGVVFANSDPRVREVVNGALRGYVTAHLIEKRYRMNEVYDATEEDGDVGSRFRRYVEIAREADVEPAEWAVPSLMTLVEKVKEQRDVDRDKAISRSGWNAGPGLKL